MSGTAVFRVTQAGTRQLARQMSTAAREMRAVVLAEFRAHVEPELEAVFAEHAPEDTGALKDNLEVRISTAGRIRATVHSTVRDPSTGFAYTDVTRFGHRGTIKPRRAKTLRFFRYGRYFNLSETAGHHPSHDWVEEAQPEADRLAGETADRVGRTIYTRLLA